MNDYRLYRQFQPRHYVLDINLEREARRFNGTVTISGSTKEAQDYIKLNAHELTIMNATIDDQVVAIEIIDENVFELREKVPAGDHTIVVEFEGVITDPMHGLYPCYFTLDGQDEELLATQFESHHAREVFPCIDEPEAKATFDLMLRTEPGVTTLSNTPIKEQQDVDGKLVTSFETTPVMSTYLLAWVVGKLDYRETKTKDGVTVRTYATPDKKDQLGFALETAVKSIEFYNEYFDIAYPLPKCDLIALPDFSSGAMENWGCITFRETALLVSKDAAPSTRQYVVTVIAHELAHQWFGNLVTMKWWNDLWLNESFANWIEYLATDHMYPEWDMWTQYYDDETTFAIHRDSLANVQKIQQEVTAPSEIQTLFDPAIVYAKGGSLLNMLHAYIGADAFREGLRVYLNRHKYTNTEANDLWTALSEVSGHDVVSFMTPWIAQSGLPVVTVHDEASSVVLEQRRFFSNPKEAVTDNGSLWPIPLLAADLLREELFNQKEVTLPIEQSARSLLLNQGRTGYYLSLYDEIHTDQLAAEVRDGKMKIIDRMGLLSDSLSLSKAGMQSELASLKLLDSYRHESSQPVWGAISDHMSALKMFVDDDEQLIERLRGFVKNLAEDQLARLGWQHHEDESYFDTLLRPMIVSQMAYSEDKDVIDTLCNMFDQAQKPSDVWADIRTIVFATAAKFKGEPAFQKLLDWYSATTSAEERVQIIVGLSSARDPELIKRALALLMTEAVKLQDLFYWVVYLSRNRHARDLLWGWMQQNWQWIIKQFGNDMHYTDFPKYMADSFSRADQFESYKQFFEPKLTVPELARTIRQGIEDIEGRVLWRERDGKAIAEYLRAQ